VPLEQRVRSALTFHAAVMDVFSLYVARGVAEGGYRREIVELIGLILRTTVLIDSGMDELLATSKHDDPVSAKRTQGLEQSRGGLATTVVAVVGILRDPSFGEERPRLIALFEEAIPALVPALEPRIREELLALMDGLLADATLERWRPSLRRLRGRIVSAARPEAQPR
jgi:hypothetical protein